MKIKKIGLIAVAVAAVLAIAAGPVQAAVISPGNESFEGLSTNSELKYGSAVLKCPESKAAGKTSATADEFASITALSFGPVAKCTTNLGASVTSITINGLPWRLHAESATGGGNGTGSIETKGTAVVVTSGFLANCKIEVPIQAVSSSWVFATQKLVVNDTSLTEKASSTGGTGCALAAETKTGTFFAEYTIKSASGKIGIF